MIALFWLVACGDGGLDEPGAMAVCGYSELLDASSRESGVGFGYTSTVLAEAGDVHEADVACAGGEELHVRTEHGTAFSFYWRTVDVPFTPRFEFSPGDSLYFFYLAGGVEDADDGFRPAGSLVVRQSSTGPLLGVLHDAPLNPASDYPELEVRPGEVFDSTLTQTDYAVVFDGDDFIAVNPGESAVITIGGIERSVGVVSARGDDAGPTHMQWAIWEP
ncbi:MAG: hypothetical protein ACI8PZ_005310 [Myxococcota bacterium]